VRHLLISREYPPASYAPGGIGTYAANIARLLADAGDTVHVIGERWQGAPREREELASGRLIVHRVALDDPGMQDGFLGSHTFPAQRFAWHAALLAESLVASEGIDVVEGQDWEAPLYYFLGRRARGLGPARRPPCIVHLHTPTEFIFLLNGWTPRRPEQLATIRMEEYCMLAADALICPSHHFAKVTGDRYAFATDAISVIPYPLGECSRIERRDDVWEDSRMLYVGRLEVRKGLLEFVEAAVEVAHVHSSVSFDFVGEDSWLRGRLSVRQHMESRIPDALRHRFRFHGLQPRSRLGGFYQQARTAVVPSRGENYPNACIEAMCSGLPVVASPNGGMVEMIDDGATGWIAPTQSAAGLAAALRCALETPAARCAAMGDAAATAIRERCDNAAIVRRQLELRQRLVDEGATRSVGLSVGGVAVPDFSPVTYAPGLALRDVLRLPAREQVALAIDAIRHPRRALTVLRSALTSRER
jgi:glycosyltransferase involved in cell wall biosynthesis